MHPKIKFAPAASGAAVHSVKPLILHDVTNRNAPANAASRRRLIPVEPASGNANHARHHVARSAQA